MQNQNFDTSFKAFKERAGTIPNSSLASNTGILYSLFLLQLLYDIDDIYSKATESITDGSSDRGIDLVYYDEETKELFVAQCYGTDNSKTAKSSKVINLRSGVEYLFTEKMSGANHKVDAWKEAIMNMEIRSLQVSYITNATINEVVKEELKNLEIALKDQFVSKSIEVICKLYDQRAIMELYNSKTSLIKVKKEIVFDNVDTYIEMKSIQWNSITFAISATKVVELYKEHRNSLYSANIREYLGLHPEDVNAGIMDSAKYEKDNFFVYNNGITAITKKMEVVEDSKKIRVEGLSIVNGTQTFQSVYEACKNLGFFDESDTLKISLKIVQCNNLDIVSKVIKFTNTQNELIFKDFRSNDKRQKAIAADFENLQINDARFYYDLKRGDDSILPRAGIGIENVRAAQYLAAFYVSPKTSYHRTKSIFLDDTLYEKVFFEGVKVENILFVYSLGEAVSAFKMDFLKNPPEEITTEMITNFLKIRGSHIFLISLISELFETIIGRAVNKKDLRFTDLSYSEMIDTWGDVVKFVLNLLVDKFVEYLKKQGQLPELDVCRDHVTLMKYTISTVLLQNTVADMLKRFRQNVSTN